ncbi:MAG: fumarylacetoacetase, partial [Paraburkholderia sp.]|nr:fumarylacetoacetase [Paraburkholderia sp.]
MSALSDLQATLDPSRKSWVESANNSTNDFSIQNLPFGIFSDKANPTRRVGVAIGDEIVDLSVLKSAGLLKLPIASTDQFIAVKDR